MTFEQWVKQNRQYRFISEWDETLTHTSFESAFIIGSKQDCGIYYKDYNHFEVIHFGVEKYSTQLEELGVKCDWDSCSYENHYIIDFKDWDKCIHIFKPKLSPKNKVSPTSVRNITTFLRYMRNISPHYNILLKNYIASRGEGDEE